MCIYSSCGGHCCLNEMRDVTLQLFDYCRDKMGTLCRRHILFLPEAQIFVWPVVCHRRLFSVIVLDDN